MYRQYNVYDIDSDDVRIVTDISCPGCGTVWALQSDLQVQAGCLVRVGGQVGGEGDPPCLGSSCCQSRWSLKAGAWHRGDPDPGGSPDRGESGSGGPRRARRARRASGGREGHSGPAGGLPRQDAVSATSGDSATPQSASPTKLARRRGRGRPLLAATLSVLSAITHA